MLGKRISASGVSDGASSEMSSQTRFIAVAMQADAFFAEFGIDG
jgi:hypothetical protein